MPNEGVIALRDSTRNYLQSVLWKRPVAITLTLKQRLKHQKLDLFEASKNFRHFMNRLNRSCFGNAVRRQDKRLRVFSVVEHNALVRFHHHGVIERPEHLEFEEFKQLIQSCWLKTNWGLWPHGHQAVTSEGWINYITKLASKPEYDLAIDWITAKI
jgi:hypothetical protein